MEDLPEALVTEILKRITRTSDLNSLSLVSKQLYKLEGNQRGAIRVGSGLCTATEALTSLCARFTNLRKLEIDYSGWIPEHGNQLDNKGLFVFSSHCSSLIDLTLSFCSCIDDSGSHYTVQRLILRRYTPRQHRISGCLKNAKSMCNT